MMGEAAKSYCKISIDPGKAENYGILGIYHEDHAKRVIDNSAFKLSLTTFVM